EGIVRLVVLSASAAMLVASLAVPGAFRSGVIFGVAYLVVRGLHLVLFSIAGRGDRDLFRAIMRTVPGAVLAAALPIVAGFPDRAAQLSLWALALAVIYLGALLGGMRDWPVSP